MAAGRGLKWPMNVRTRVTWCPSPTSSTHARTHVFVSLRIFQCHILISSKKIQQPRPYWRKGCVPRKINVSRNFLKFNFFSHAQEKLQKCASKCTIKNQDCCQYKIEYNIIYLFPARCKILFHNVFKFTPAGKIYRKVEFTWVGELLYKPPHVWSVFIGVGLYFPSSTDVSSSGWSI
jgi:hypothetical protein